MFRVDAEFVGDGYVFLAVARGDGTPPGLWLLDTGASVCVVDRRAARQVAMARTGAQIEMSSAGRRSSPLSRLSAVDVVGTLCPTCDRSAVRALNVDAIVQPLDGLWATIGGAHRRRYVGILGYTWLRRHVVRIDYRRRSVWLQRAAQAASPSLQQVTPLRTRVNAQGMVLVDAALDRLPPIGNACSGAGATASWWIADTGADSTLVSANAVRAWRLADAALGDRSVTFTLADRDEIPLVRRRFAVLRLARAAGAADLLVPRPPSVLLDVEGGIGALQCAAVGTLGNEVFQRLGVVWLDYRAPSRVIWVERRQSDDA